MDESNKTTDTVSSDLEKNQLVSRIDELERLLAEKKTESQQTQASRLKVGTDGIPVLEETVTDEDGHPEQQATLNTLKNNDDVAHNPNISTLRNPGFNRLLRPGDQIGVAFTRAEPFPVMATGNIHPWLRACLVVTDHPYATFTDANGEFEIMYLPTGQRILQMWHERAGYIESATLDGQSITWKKGRVTVHVQPGTYDMGDISNTAVLTIHKEGIICNRLGR